MSDYPKRGQMSADGRYYTHTDGTVHTRVEGAETCCRDCSMGSAFEGCLAECTYCTYFVLVEGAHVSTDEESEACDMARKMIALCQEHVDLLCNMCMHITHKSCPARAYLASHGCADAWEVKP